MKVLITGGGIGGLALAQGLLARGDDVQVIEKGSFPSGPSGYRMRMDSRACGILRDILPPPIYTALLASGAGKAVTHHLGYFDEQLHPLGQAREDDDDVLMIGRGPLRRLLAHGLDDHIWWNSRAASFAVEPDAVAVTLDDGTVERGDALVISEGVHSRLRDQLLGQHANESLQVAAVCGRIPGTAAEHDLTMVADAVADGYALASAANGFGLFLSEHDPARGIAIDPAAVGPVPADIEDAYLVWGLAGPEDDMPDADVTDATELITAAGRHLCGWHDQLAALPELSDRPTVQRYVFNASTGTPIWPTTAATLIGDAVHTVPPTGGVGASTAIRDAGALLEKLPSTTARAEILSAFHEYEQHMRTYADQVVADSVAPLNWQNRLSNPMVHRVATRVLATVNAASGKLTSR